MKNLRAFEVTFLGPTNKHESSVKIKDLRFKVSKTIRYDHEFNSTYEVAADYLAKKGITLCNMAEGHECYILLTDNFNSQIK